MTEIHLSAPGKIFLMGEHAVVYGKPGLIAAFDKRCYVTIIPRLDNIIEIISRDFNCAGKYHQARLEQMAINAGNAWNEFAKTNNHGILTNILSDKLDFPAIIIGQAVLYFQKSLPSGFDLIIDSKIPVGCGLGSSGALAVAITAGMSLFLGRGMNKRVINNLAYQSEQKMHGFPSGADNSASCYGGLIWYRKETPDLRIIQALDVSWPRNLQNNFFLINTGRPLELTSQMVASVRKMLTARPRFVYQILSSQESLTRDLLIAIEHANEQEIIRIIKTGERNLEKLVVVSEKVIKMIRYIEKLGGAAKICGAGGREEASGIVMCYHKDENYMKQQLADKYHFEIFDKLSLPCSGVRVEKS